MTLKEAIQAFDSLKKLPKRPSNYMIGKSYIDTIFHNFNWETMKEPDRVEFLHLLDKSFEIFESIKRNDQDLKRKNK